eukprot:379896_1
MGCCASRIGRRLHRVRVQTTNRMTAGCTISNKTNTLKQISPCLTPTNLKKDRDEFWETRLEGRTEVWQALRLECGEKDHPTRKAIHRSAGLTPFASDEHGYRHCFDEWGAKYELPTFLLRDPPNLAKEHPRRPSDLPVVDGPEIRFTVRLSGSGEDLPVVLPCTSTVAQLVDHIRERTRTVKTRVRIVALGQRLQERLTLREYGVRHGTLLQALMTRPFES